MSSIEPRVIANYQTAEYGKFVELVNNTEFPPVSVTRFNSPNVAGMAPMSSVEVYPKYAVITYDAGRSGTNSSPFGDNSSLDAFGRLRTSSPKTLFDAKQLYDKLPQVFDEVVSGAATSTFVPGDSLTLMQTFSAGDYAIRQTSMHFNYQPGKSMLANFTGVFQPETNVIKRVGLFQGSSAAPHNPEDGIFLESADGPNGYIAFKVLKTQGTASLLSAAQSEWNLDKLDGTGPSGLTIDFTHAQLMVIDYEWLSVGRIRCGFYVAGKPLYCHTFSNFNILSAPYMTSSNQPVRYEIRQTGAGSGNLKHICSSVMSEGGEPYIGTTLTADMSAAVSLVDTAFRPVLAVRLNPIAHDLSLVIKNIHNLNTGINDAIFKVLLNPTITGGSLTYKNLSYNDKVQFAEGSATLGVSGGYAVASSFVNKGNAAVAAGTGGVELLGELSVLGTKINGTPDTFVIAAKGLTGSTTMYSAIDMVLRA